MALPVEQKREFAKKILRKVAIHTTAEDQAERRKNLAAMLGLDEGAITPELEACVGTLPKAMKLKGALFRMLEEPKSPMQQELA